MINLIQQICESMRDITLNHKILSETQKDMKQLLSNTVNSDNLNNKNA